MEDKDLHMNDGHSVYYNPVWYKHPIVGFLVIRMEDYIHHKTLWFSRIKWRYLGVTTPTNYVFRLRKPFIFLWYMRTFLNRKLRWFDGSYESSLKNI